MNNTHDFKDKMGSKLDLTSWSFFKEEKDLVYSGKKVVGLSKKVYRKKINEKYYSIGVHNFLGKDFCVAYGLVGTCFAHGFIDNDNNFLEIVDGCIEYMQESDDKIFVDKKYVVEKDLSGNIYFRKTDILPGVDYFSKTYYPIYAFLAITFVFSFFINIFFKDGGLHSFMNLYMGIFFLIFGVLKFLNLNGFIKTFQKYDPLAKEFYAYGIIYPFLEIFLGFCFVLNVNLFWANLLTIMILGITTSGILNAISKKENLTCACLGGFFNIPIGPITVFENAIMILMALYMLL
jgi:hypothetical protein